MTLPTRIVRSTKNTVAAQNDALSSVLKENMWFLCLTYQWSQELLISNCQHCQSLVIGEAIRCRPPDSWLIVEPKVGKHKSDWQIVTRIKDPTSRNKAEKHPGFKGKKQICFSAKDATWQVFVQEIRKRKKKSQSLMLKKQRFRK